MAGSMKDIKRRIKSVESTGQITKAMELVASSKLRKAKERAEAARPFFETLYETITDIASMNKDFTTVYTKKREVKASLFIVIAGDRGLAGGYNANVLKLAVEQMKDKNAKVLSIGSKSVDFFGKNGYEVVGEFLDVAEDLDNFSVGKIGEIADTMYKKAEVDEVYVVYTQFISALNQQPVCMPILPLSLMCGDSQGESLQLMEYEPSPEGVFNSIIPSYISGIIYGAVVESFASEQGARRTAMESASDNANEMIQTLSLSYNRARQAAITQEISEIVAGAGS